MERVSGAPSAKVTPHGNVQALLNLGGIGNFKAGVQVVALQVHRHVLGDALLPVVHDNLVHRGVGAGAEADQGGLRPGGLAVGHRQGGNGEVDPGVLPAGPLDADEGPGVPHRGDAAKVFDLHC